MKKIIYLLCVYNMVLCCLAAPKDFVCVEDPQGNIQIGKFEQIIANYLTLLPQEYIDELHYVLNTDAHDAFIQFTSEMQTKNLLDPMRAFCDLLLQDETLNRKEQEDSGNDLEFHKKESPDEKTLRICLQSICEKLKTHSMWREYLCQDDAVSVSATAQTVIDMPSAGREHRHNPATPCVYRVVTLFFLSLGAVALSHTIPETPLFIQNISLCTSVFFGLFCLSAVYVQCAYCRHSMTID